MDEHIVKEFAVEGLHSGHDNDVKIVTQIPIHVIKEIQMIKKYKYVYIKEFAAGGLHSEHDNDVKIVRQIQIHVIKEIQMQRYTNHQII